jgi:pyroglutamyl-peptidase
MTAVMYRILVTGFEPFGSVQENVSEVVATRLAAPEGSELRTLVLPVSFGDAWRRLKSMISDFGPDCILALGLAEERRVITPELVAINFMDARIPDNRGRQPMQTRIHDDAPAAYFSTLPVHAMAADLTRAGHPASVSYSAGAFVCNYLMYELLHYVAGPQGAPSPAGAAPSRARVTSPGGASVPAGWATTSPAGAPLAGFVHLPGQGSGANADSLIQASSVMLETIRRGG